jgi:hypothetical protein
MQNLGPRRLNRALNRNLVDKGGAVGVFASAPLDLRFALQKTLDPRVSFTRASSGTYVGSDGLIKTAVTNLVTYSEQFDNAVWTKTNSTVTTNATTAPNGTLTAEKLITNSGASSGRASVSITAAANTSATLSCFAKQGETSVFGLFISDGVTGRAADFNLITGTVSGTPTAGMTASIEAVGDGWYRCVATVTSITGTTRSLRVVQTVVANDGIKGLYIWGAQFEETSTVGEYVPTTSAINSAPRFDHNPTTGESLGLLVEEARTNPCLQSEDFATTWTSQRVTITANTTLAPNGTTTADTITGNGATGGTQSVYQSVTASASTAYTISVYAKAGTSTWMTIQGFDGTTNCRAWFDLVNGATGTVETGMSNATITNAGGGWYRCSVVRTTGASSTSLRPQFGQSTSNGTEVTGGVLTFALWGAQVEAGAFPTSYIPTTTATVTRAADVASITGSNFGTTRTNLLLKSEEFNAVFWANVFTTEDPNVAVAPNETSTADKLIENSGAGFKSIEQQVAVSALTYTFSVYVKAVERSIVQLLWSGGASTDFANFNLITGTVTAGTYTSATITPAGSDWFRISITSALNAGNYSGIVSLQTNASAARAASYTGDGTSGLFLWGAQLETGSTATTYIPTTTAAASVFESSFYNQTEGTVFADAKVTTVAPATFLTSVFALSDGTTNNRITVYKRANADTSTRLDVQTSGSSVAFINAGTFGVSNLIAASYRVDDFAISLNGLTPGTDTLGAIPTISRLNIGNYADSTFPLNGTIKRLTYWPTRFASTTLETITRP